MKCPAHQEPTGKHTYVAIDIVNLKPYENSSTTNLTQLYIDSTVTIFTLKSLSVWKWLLKCFIYLIEFFKACNFAQFRNITGAASTDDCVKCDDGMYCEGQANTVPTGKCAAGYYCLQGNSLERPNNSSIGGMCPEGRICEKGTSIPTKCATGNILQISFAKGVKNFRNCVLNF